MSESLKYDPSGVGVKGSIFGLPFNESEASVIILPVPWDVTVSYAEGTVNGPEAVLAASVQLDLEMAGSEAPWKKGIWMAPIDPVVKEKSQALRVEVLPYLQSLEDGTVYENTDEVIAAINQGTTELKSSLKQKTLSYLKKGKVVGLLGGDHSCPLGYLEALGEHHDSFGILQIDAHMDLRNSYEGFEHSHASIMYNVVQLPSVIKLVQVGIRDFCEEETAEVESNPKIEVYYDQVLKSKRFEGQTWKSICKGIVDALPQKVYVSFDIDGLHPSLCPGTGTPVPGGLQFEEAVYLIGLVKASGRNIIGFDLCEVAPMENDREWNANVGARILYALCGVV